MSQLTNLDGHEIEQKIGSMTHQQFPAIVLLSFFYYFVNTAFPDKLNCLRFTAPVYRQRQQMVQGGAMEQLCICRFKKVQYILDLI